MICTLTEITCNGSHIFITCVVGVWRHILNLWCVCVCVVTGWKLVTDRSRVFENRILRKVLGAKRDEVMEDWRRLHNEELRGLCSSSNVVRVIKARRIR